MSTIPRAEAQFIVKFNPGAVDGTTAQDLAAALGAHILDDGGDLHLWSVDPARAEAFLTALSDNPAIAFVEANTEIALCALPDDPKLGRQWSLTDPRDYDIDAEEAWQVSTGEGVTVAVIDTGIDLTHPDLNDNLWVNPGEIAGNGVDDDGNGYVDDVHGWDFVNNDNLPMDDHSHGTHVAGTIAAEGNNGTGVTGVAWSANLMALKAFNAHGGGSSYAIAKALDYATAMGADISNNSWRLTGYSKAVDEAIARADAADHLVVLASGNDSRNIDNTDFTATLPHGNILTVTAHNASGGRPSWANWGKTSVDLAAPGAGILSTMPGGGYGTKSGTSMATPHATGAAALLLSANPDLTPREIRDILMMATDPLDSVQGITVTGGRLNAGAAVGADTDVPAEVPTIDMGVTQAEDLALTGFAVEVDAVAAGGAMIRVPGYKGAAEAVFGGAEGTYILRVSYFDENDGAAAIGVSVNGETVDAWTLDEASASNAATPETLFTRDVTVTLSTGDTLRLDATADDLEYARIDQIEIVDGSAPVDEPISGGNSGQSLTPAAIEAEAMTLTGYRVETIAAASGGQGLRLDGGATGSAAFEWSGEAGTYDIVVHYFDEDDGASTFTLSRGNTLIEAWVADADPVGNGASAATATSHVISGVTLETGDAIVLTGTSDYLEYARLDRVDVVPVGEDDAAAPTSGRIEAEAMTFAGGYEAESLACASGGAAAKLPKGDGTLSFTWSGAAGTYDLLLGLFDENDGKAPVSVTVDGQDLASFVLDAELGANAATPETAVVRALGTVELSGGEEIVITGARDGWEYTRVDYLEFAAV